MATGKRALATIFLGLLSGTVGYLVRLALGAWGILDPVALWVGEWLKMNATGDQAAILAGLVCFALLYGASLFFIWRNGRSTRANSTEDTVVHNYNNCTVHQYPDGTARAEPNTPHWDHSHPTFVIFKPMRNEILSSNNVSSVTDTGSGEFTVGFANPVSGNYAVDVDAGGSISFETTEYADCVEVRLLGEEPEKLQIVVRKLDD